MKKLFFKITFYSVLILLGLELVIRIFHLTKDYPRRYIDEFGVEKWMPNQEGYSVKGNRRQNFSKYHINNSGFNSYREFTPTKNKVEIALVGDSFIEGFHQNYYNSIGKKIENKINNIEVYEFGYAGYDFADQLHLISEYKPTFDLIDLVVLGLKFENDLFRNEYQVVQDRMRLESPQYKNIRKIRLLIYAQNNGFLDPFWKLARYLSSIGTSQQNQILKTIDAEVNLTTQHLEYLENFKTLIRRYGYDKDRFMLLLDSEITPQVFLNYLMENNYTYIDTYDILNTSKKPTTLIYDRHWNNHGRDLIADLIARHVSKKVN